MILVADSGSTKTDWIAVDDFGREQRFQSSGINPFFRDTASIVEELTPIFAQRRLPVEAVWFYGAGVVNDQKAAVVSEALSQVLGPVRCQVAGDVLGAARALCATQPGIVCILGTGSNACFFDGERVVGGIPPMGFILGDECSGAVLGRQLLGDYFKLAMPLELRAKFGKRFSVTKDDVLERVYRTERPNRYLASFAPFLSEERENAYCSDLVKSQLRAFIGRNVVPIPESRELPVHFTGSVAWHFRDWLTDELRQAGLQPGTVLQEPIEALARFHQLQP